MPRSHKTKLDVFSYSDFRVLLKDRLHERQELNPDLSMRDLAKEAGFGSPSFFKMIIDGKRKLTRKTLPQVVPVLQLDEKQTVYFETLVAFNQAQDPQQKKQLADQLDDLQPRSQKTSFRSKQKKILEEDHHIVIREMVLLKDFCEDAKWIASRCLPRITPDEARDSLRLLLDLGLLKYDENEKLVQSEPTLDTGSQTGFIEAFQFHQNVLEKAQRYLCDLEQSQRRYTALTLPLPQAFEKIIRDKVEALENDILKLINDTNCERDEVFQLNIQFFPVTQPRGSK